MQYTFGYKINLYFSNYEILKIKELPAYYRALALIGRIYKEEKDRSGNPTIGHFIRVSEFFPEETDKIIGLLHDVVEDGYLTFDDLLFLDFSEEIIDTLIILTRDKLVFPEYEDYITNIIESNNVRAIRIKYGDMFDNSSPIRISKLDKELGLRLSKKYETQLPRLEEKLQELNEFTILERKLAC